MRICPYCKQQCISTSNVTKAKVGGKYMHTDGKQLVWICEKHGIMQIAAYLTDKYMRREFPNLVLRNGSYVPKE